MAENNDSTLPTPSSRGRYREVWIGVFVLVGLVATLTLLFTLTDPSMFRGRYILRAEVTDAGGIRRGDPVQLLGVIIGRVQSFKIAPKGVEIRLEIEGEYSIPKGSIVELRQNSLLGTMTADVVPGNGPGVMRDGEEIPGRRPEGLFDAMAMVKDKASVVLDSAGRALSPKTVEGIQSSVTELDQVLKEMRGLTAEQRKELRSLTESLRKVADNVAGATGRPEIDRSIARLDTITEQLQTTTASLTRSSGSLETVLGRIERGEGTLGKLSKDDELYVRLNKAVTSLGQLAEDVRQQPKKYLKLSLF
jgi:phospholipid/cholesterol/gamma-HCH transport system substrate-binding protein